MPEVRIIFFRKTNGRVPLKDWLEDLTTKERRKCLERIERLREHSHKLERPYAASLRDEIYELRVESGNVNYRMFYFFRCKIAVVLTHGMVKKTQKVPANEIDKAIKRKGEFETDPAIHSFEWEP